MNNQPLQPMNGPVMGNQPMAQEQLRDILPPVLLPEEPNYMFFVVIALVFILLLGVLLWFFKFRKKKISLPGSDETALAELQQLRKLMAQETAPRYAKKLSAVLRRYIENRFHIPTVRQTTKEFFIELTTMPSKATSQFEAHRESLKTCLEQCDMAKFAKAIPDQHSMEQMEAAVQQFVEATREERGGKK